MSAKKLTAQEIAQADRAARNLGAKEAVEDILRIIEDGNRLPWQTFIERHPEYSHCLFSSYGLSECIKIRFKEILK